METVFLQVYPQGRIVTSVAAKTATTLRWNRTRVKQMLRDQFCIHDDGRLVWFRWNGSEELTIEIDWPKDRFSLEFLKTKAECLGKLVRDIGFVTKTEVYVMDRVFCTH